MPLNGDEPICPHCDSSLVPEHLTEDVYVCNCCAMFFRWSPPKKP